jgi:hypothetical protein
MACDAAVIPGVRFLRFMPRFAQAVAIRLQTARRAAMMPGGEIKYAIPPLGHGGKESRVLFDTLPRQVNFGSIK